MKMLKISFKSETQLPALMIIEETWEYGQCTWAEVIYSTDVMPAQLIVGDLVVRKYGGPS